MKIKNFGEWINLDGVEVRRTYCMPSGQSYTIFDPVKLLVKETGSHKLVDKKGNLHYIKANWEYFTAVGSWKFDVEEEET